MTRCRDGYRDHCDRGAKRLRRRCERFANGRERFANGRGGRDEHYKEV